MDYMRNAEGKMQRKDLVPRRLASVAQRRWSGDPLAQGAQEGETTHHCMWPARERAKPSHMIPLAPLRERESRPSVAQRRWLGGRGRDLAHNSLPDLV